jgi:hypothetical protein
MEQFFAGLYQTYLRLREAERFSAKHPMMSFTEFCNIQRKVWLDIPSGNGPVSIIQL